jgi:hypothetical protein
VAVPTDDERRIAWTHRLIGTEPKPEGGDWRESGKYVGVLNVGWVKRTFGQGGKPLSGTALSYWRKKGIPLEHMSRMTQELRALLPDTTKDAAPEGAAEKLLKLWTGDQPPNWSNIQVKKVIEAIHQDRAEAMVAMARRLGRMTAEELQELLSRLPDESSPKASDP